MFASNRNHFDCSDVDWRFAISFQSVSCCVHQLKSNQSTHFGLLFLSIFYSKNKKSIQTFLVGADLIFKDAYVLQDLMILKNVLILIS